MKIHKADNTNFTAIRITSKKQLIPDTLINTAKNIGTTIHGGKGFRGRENGFFIQSRTGTTREAMLLQMLRKAFANSPEINIKTCSDLKAKNSVNRFDGYTYDPLTLKPITIKNNIEEVKTDLLLLNRRTQSFIYGLLQ